MSKTYYWSVPARGAARQALGDRAYLCEEHALQITNLMLELNGYKPAATMSDAAVFLNGMGAAKGLPDTDDILQHEEGHCSACEAA